MFLKKNARRKGLFKAACLGLALLTTTPAMSNVTRVSELVDVDPNVWAYKALKELVEKYDVLEGYPNKTFRGNKPATRYELAQALYEVLKVMDLGKAEPGDIETISRLKREFDRELSSIRSKVASLEGRVSALEAGAAGGEYVIPHTESWTDRIKISGDITSNLRTDWVSRDNRGDAANWGTRARVGVDAILIADDNSGGVLGEGIAHIRMNGGNGGPGTFSYDTTGNNLDDIAFDGSNPSFGSNNSLFAGRTQDSRMDVYLDQAYYTQVFKFSKTDPCSNETREFPNFFAVVDVGQQDLWNTFHKSLVREDSLDGFINQRVLHGMLGASDAITEAIHLGLTWLGDDNEGVDACGNLQSGPCGEPLPGFFQALSLDYAFATHKIFGAAQPTLVDPATGNPIAASIDPASVYTTSQVWDNHSHNIAANFLHDLPGEFLGTGLITVGSSFNHANFNYGTFNGLPVTLTGADDDWGWTLFTKIEQYFGLNRTFGVFFDYSYSSDDRSSALVNGAIEHLAQAGMVLNTTFMPDTWNFNKDQIGLAYSWAMPHDNVNNTNFAITTATPSSAIPYGAWPNNQYIDDDRAEQIVEAYYRKYVTEHISITPDVMFQMNGNGHNTAISASLRATFKLPNWNDGGAFDQFGYRDWSQRLAKYKAAHSLVE